MVSHAYSDEFGIQRIIFNNIAVQHMLEKPAEQIRSYELIIIGALLYHIDSLIQNENKSRFVNIEKMEFFPEHHLAVLIYQAWDLNDPKHLQVFLELAQLFAAQSHRFTQPPGEALSSKTKKIIEKRIQTQMR